MPSSTSEAIPYEIEFIRKNRPNLKTVLDVGIGFGKGAFLIREYFDVKVNNLYNPKDWKVQITGVEVYPTYLSELQKLLYNKIIIGDIIDILPTLGKFELGILGDVIEHFPKEQGKLLITQLFDHVEDLVIATPNGYRQHAATGENIHEEHKSGWELADFESFTVIDQAVIPRIRKEEEVLVVYLRKESVT